MLGKLSRVLVSLTLTLVALASVSATAQSLLSGRASVVDGDTLDIHGERIRLHGVDSPERDGQCKGVNVYRKAADALDALIRDKTVSCTIVEKDRYGRTVASCKAGGVDLATEQTTSGWTRDWPRYSQGRYADAEKQARALRVGIWAEDCPEVWGDRRY